VSKEKGETAGLKMVPEWGRDGGLKVKKKKPLVEGSYRFEREFRKKYPWTSGGVGSTLEIE